MTQDEKEYLRKAIANGGNYTTAIRPLGSLGMSAIKQATISQPWGHETLNPIGGILGKAILQKKRADKEKIKTLVKEIVMEMASCIGVVALAVVIVLFCFL